jgi:CheY-like chemotaxis protein
MLQDSWRILIIDDKAEMTQDAKREIEDAFADDAAINVTVIFENDFDEGYARVQRDECDVVILDVRHDGDEDVLQDEEAGRKVFSRIQQVRFLPVIFWTARPDQVKDQQMEPLVSVFKKDDLELIPDAIRKAIASRAVEVMTGIERNVASIMRTHMWQELAPNWNEDTVGGRADELARILITRVAQSLQDKDLPELTARPSHCYLYPPVSPKLRPGDLIKLETDSVDEWWVILTPACDLEIEGKIDYILLGRALSLAEFGKYQLWKTAASSKDKKDTWSSLEFVLRGAQHRYQYYPAFREIPDLILDLEAVKSLPLLDVADYKRVASLVGPYSEALLVKHSHFRGRIGVPNLNTAYVKSRLSER